MSWLLANWFWILFLALFVGMHLVGHGGHGGHSGHGSRDLKRNDESENDKAQPRVVNTSSVEHQH